MTEQRQELDTALEDLSRHIDGDVVVPGDGDYDEARAVWNGMIDRRPAAVVRAADIGDVAPVVAFARRHALPLAVRGGGHNVAGNGTVDGGMVLDLRDCNAVGVDTAAGTVTVEPGATLAEVDAATTPHGLVVPGGVISTTGVAGLTLGGGFGWLTRKHGLTIDSLRAAELVTADGDTVRASADENPDLLWGLRGGGGNFGIVTSFTFGAHPLPQPVYAGNLVYGRAKWKSALRAYVRWTRDLPDELTSILTLFTPPEELGMGAEPLLVCGFVWAGGDHAAGERCVAPLLADAPPDDREIRPVQWPAWQSSMDVAFPRGKRAYWKNTSYDRFDDDVIDLLVARAEEQTWRGTAFDIHHMGGAMRRVPADATAFPERGSEFWLNIYGFWGDAEDDARNIAFVRGFAADMQRFSTGGQYVNFLGAEDPGVPGTVSDDEARDRARAVYGAGKLERLAELKRRYDPENVFRLNHNIPPGQPAGTRA